MELTFIVIALPFSLLAAVMAFLIVWSEYYKHKITGKKLFYESFRAALLTFLVFFVLMLAAGYVLNYYVLNTG